ncbi:hypothetical protein HID58_040122 [Brassica napus]|uniref:Misato Segment II tubulin-like domain-containing protein n=1 Tax=Brassica napus TaxID=3708 RepID=A0ABQ8B730_BRANA|nr:hypothetical protein HID58_040122 [Brassica napus]
MRREIVTIQVGEFANFIGSHFWNFQDELLALASDPESDPIFPNHNLDMDVLYRSGENQQGVSTYTPRLLSVNFEGSMRSSGTLYNEGSSSISNSSKTWGEILSTPGSDSMYRGSLDVHSLPVATRWRPSSVILPFLESRLGNLERLGIQRGAMGSYVARKWGFGEEELQDMRENLSNMVSKLSPHHSSDSDSD